MAEGVLENLTGGGVNGSGNPDGRGALNQKYILAGNFQFHRCFNRFNRYVFKKLLCLFKFYYSFKLQTS